MQTWGELLGEALVIGPEETDVGDVEEHHRQALQAKAVASGGVDQGFVIK